MQQREPIWKTLYKAAQSVQIAALYADALYMQHEIERILLNHIPMESYIVVGDRPVRISPETVERSKSLSKLERERKDNE